VSNAYGPQTPATKRDFLSDISNLGLLLKDHEWILGGYFNLITYLGDNKGSECRLDPKDQSFKDLVDQLCLINILGQEEVILE
jgi:hypothetical protein